MKRRVFVVRVGGTALALPFAVFAQRQTIPFLGFLSSGSPNERAHFVEAFRQGLKDGGYIDGQDVAIEYRWAEGRFDRLPGLAAELVGRKVALIFATGGMLPALAAKRATSTIPIVFTGPSDPVKLGLVVSLSRPGGNVTGVVNISSSLDRKRLEILRELVPDAATIIYLLNPKSPDAQTLVDEIQLASGLTGTKVRVLEASTAGEIEIAFATIKQSRANALLVATDAFLLTRRDQIVALAAQYAIPAAYAFREFVVAGGLMSYGADNADILRQAGLYAARILKGAKPADLPVIQSSKFELVVNLKTAKKLGRTLTRDFLARIDELIQ
jgi:putative ABC transport system substrate-binding protein